MGSSFSSNKKNYYSSHGTERLLYDEDSNSNTNSNSNSGAQIEYIKNQIIKMKDDNQKLKVEIKSLYEKNLKLETEINKIQTNHGNEIYNLNQNVSSIQKDIVTLMNNQKIISEVLQNNSTYNYNSINTNNNTISPYQ